MKVSLSFCKYVLLLIVITVPHLLKAQLLVDMVDTSSTSDKGLWAVYKKSDHLQIGGYFQPAGMFARPFGYTYWLSKGIKLLFWYDVVKNEKTSLAGYTRDVKDNIFTCRMQFRF